MKLSEQLKNVEEFNKDHISSHWNKLNGDWADYDVKGLKLEKSGFEGVRFSGDLSSEETSLKTSTFDRCTFDYCVFEWMRWEDLNFKDCEFNHCRFKNVQWASCRFENPKFVDCDLETSKEKGIVIDSTMFTKPLFQDMRFDDAPLFMNSTFRSPTFRRTIHDGGDFVDCQFITPEFDSVQFKRTSFTRGVMDHPVFSPIDPVADMDAGSMTVIGVHLKPKFPKGDVFNFSGFQKDASFDLSDLEASFGCDGGENLEVHDYNVPSGEVGFADGILTNAKIWNIRADGFSITADNRTEATSVDNVDADYVFLDLAKFKNCVFSNFHIHKGLSLKGSTFENCRWENIKLDPGAKVKAAGSTYENKLPF